MQSQEQKPSPANYRPSFFGLPASWHLWSRVAPTHWGGVLGGVLAGLGLGLFVAKILQDLELWKWAWVGFLAVVLVGIGQAIALGAAQRSLQREKDQPQIQ